MHCYHLLHQHWCIRPNRHEEMGITSYSSSQDHFFDYEHKATCSLLHTTQLQKNFFFLTLCQGLSAASSVNCCSITHNCAITLMIFPHTYHSPMHFNIDSYSRWHLSACLLGFYGILGVGSSLMQHAAFMKFALTFLPFFKMVIVTCSIQFILI